MEIRKSRMADLPEILKLYEEARAFMQETGNGTQWGDILSASGAGGD